MQTPGSMETHGFSGEICFGPQARPPIIVARAIRARRNDNCRVVNEKNKSCEIRPRDTCELLARNGGWHGEGPAALGG